MKRSIYLLFALSILLFSCKQSAKKTSEVVSTETEGQLSYVSNAPDWSKNANIYEVNVRQYTEEGTFNAFSTHLDRLKNMGVDILWLMPIHPISKKNRKGSLGSYYAVKDYKDVNPDFGTKEDFKMLVDKAHSLGMKLILDWVPNHTGFDNLWIEDHPEWYTKNDKGEVTHPLGTDWTDVADLNYDNAEMRKAMTESMLYWIQDFDIDGYRCDVAGEVPNDFWAENNKALSQAKEVFMLAEWDDPSLHQAGFHMTYGWGTHHKFNQVAKNEITLIQLDSFLTADKTKYGEEAYRMNFITNHDENSWNGTIEERMGAAADALAVLAFTVDGMPLIYSGQEAGLDWRLKFFEKDQIKWDDLSKADFYTTLLELKHNNKALWNGSHGGQRNMIATSNDKNIFCYSREKGGDKVIVAINMSENDQFFKTLKSLNDVEMTDIFNTDQKVNPANWNKEKTHLKPWSYVVLSSK